MMKRRRDDKLAFVCEILPNFDRRREISWIFFTNVVWKQLEYCVGQSVIGKIIPGFVGLY